MVTDAELKRELIRDSVKGYQTDAVPPLDALEALRVATKGNVFTDGQSTISVSSNGHSVSFQTICSKDQLLRVIGQAIDWIEAQEDPLAFDLPRVAHRLRFNFTGSTCT